MNKKTTKAELLVDLEKAQQRIAALESIANKESEARFASIFRASPTPMALTDSITGKYVEVNDAFLHILGFEREEVIGTTTLELNLPADLSQRGELLQRMAAQGYLRHEPVLVRTRTGEIRQGIFSAEYVHADDQKYILTTIISFPEKEIVEQGLVSEILRRRVLFEESPDGILVIDPQTAGFLEFNTAAHTQLGYSRQEFARISVFDIEAQETADETQKHIVDVLRNGRTDFETLQRTKQGEIRNVHVTAQVVELLGQQVYYCTWRDITERKRAEAALRASEATLSEALELAKLGHWEYDVESDRFAFNDHFYAIFHTSAEQMGGYELSSAEYAQRFVHPEDAAIVGIEIARALAFKDQNYRVKLEHRILYADGGVGYISVEIHVHRNDQGKIIRFYGINQDITERKLAEEKLRESEARYRNIFENAVEGIYRSTPSGNYLDINPAFARTAGFNSPDEMKAAITDIQYQLYVHPEDRARLKTILERQGRVYNFVVEVRRKDGSTCWVSINSTAIRDVDGNILYYEGTTEDITERKQAEERLRQSEAKYRLLVETSIEGIWSMDQEHRTTYVNRAMAELLGYEPAEMLGKKVEEYFFPEDMEFHQTRMEKRHSGQDEVYERRFKRKDGSPLWTLVSARVQKDSQGNFNGSFAMFTDITERKLAEQALRESERKLSTLLSNLIGFAYRCKNDRDWTIEYVSDGCLEITGYAPEDLIENQTLTYSSLIHPADSERVWKTIQSALVAQTSYHLEYRIITRDGNERWVWEQGRGVSSGNTLTALEGFITDITDNKLAEQALLTSEEKYRKLSLELEQRVQQRTAEIEATRQRLELATQTANMGVWDWNVKTGQLIWDAQTYAIHGLSPDRFQVSIESFFSSIVYPEDLPILEQFIRRALVGQFSEQAVYRIVRGDGTPGYIKVHGTIRFDVEGQPEHVVGVVQDITLEKLAEKALRESEETFRAVFDTSPDVIGVFDAQANVLMFNQIAAQIFGYPSTTEMIGKNALDFHLPDDIPSVTKLFQRLFADGYVRNIQFPLQRKDGSTFSAEISYAALYDVNHNPRGIIAITRDITERKHSEETLRRANIELARAMRMKDEFLANMSHELRTPLNGILGLSESLQLGTYGVVSEKQLRALINIESSGRHLLSLINDILDLSKIEAGKLDLYIDPVSVADLCQASLSFVKEPSIKKGVATELVSDPLATTVLADQRRLKQILVNLLSNAVKFSPAGGRVTLKVQANLQQHTLDFSVIDTGIGIAQDDLARLFNPFTQVDSSLTRQYEGTGLGLALVKELTELHGGSIQVRSEVGKGSTFTVSLPWQPEAAAMGKFSAHQQVEAKPVSAHDTRHQLETILLADDVDLNILAIGDYLEGKGYNMIYASNGREAVELARIHAPALILMDVQMPEMNGLEAIRRLRADPQFADVPIIALTAMAMTGDRERCLAAGATAYISKPVALKHLLEMMRDLLNKDNEAGAAGTA